jgi:hypothetical protein
MFKYLLVDQAVPAMCRSRAAARLRADYPSGSPAERMTKWQRRLYTVSLPIFPPPILGWRIRFGQMWTRRYVASAIPTDGIAHLGWLASELRGSDKAFQSLHEQLVDVIPNRG